MIFKKKINTKKLYLFIEQLSNLMDAGLRLSNALEIIIKNEKDKQLKKVLYKINREILHGKNVYDSFSRFSNYFDKNFLILLKIGESSENLTLIFQNILKILKNKLEQRKRILDLITYPLIIIISIIFVIIFMVSFILPDFIELFNENNIILPLSTKILIYLYNNFLFFAFYFFIIVAIFYFLIKYINKNNEMKLKKDIFYLKIPIIKNIIKQNTAIYIFRNFSILLESGVNILEISNILKDDIKNSKIRNDFIAALENVKNGESISYNLVAIKIVPALYENIIIVGEESGDIITSFNKLVEIIERDLDNYIKMLFVILRPLLILTIGFLILFIAISIYTPILNMSNII